MLCLCCALYLEPGCDAELGGLVQPAAAAAGDGSKASQPPGSLDGDGCEVLTIADSEEDEEAGPPPSGSGSAVEGLAAAVAALLAAAAQQQPAAAAVLPVGQHACAHALRLLAAAPGAASLQSLLLDLLSGLVQACRQHLAVQASAAAAPQPDGPPSVALRLSEPQHAEQLQEQAAALASGLLLELLPLPLVSAAALVRQQHQLAAAAETVRWGLSQAGLAAPAAALRQRLEAALTS